MKTIIVKKIVKPLWVGFFLLIALFSFAASETAKERQPLPPALKNGKTVYLLSIYDDPSVWRSLQGRMKKWHRWEIVPKPSQADLLLVFTCNPPWLAQISSQIRRFRTTGQFEDLPKPPVPVSPYSIPVYLAFLDFATGEELLRVSCDRRGSAEFTAQLLFNRLKTSIEIAEKQEKKRK